MSLRGWRKMLLLAGLATTVGFMGCGAPETPPASPPAPAATATPAASATPAIIATPAATATPVVPASPVAPNAPTTPTTPTQSAAPVPLPNTGDETAQRNETNFQASMPAAVPMAPALTPTPLPIGHETVAQTVDGVPVAGYLAQTAGAQAKGAVLLLHEWWGLTPPVEQQADWLAGQGYKALAFDLYGGKIAKNRAEAAGLMRQVKFEEVLPRLKAAVTLLAQNGQAAPLKVGVIGWGFGGGLAVRLAEDEPRLGALVVYYGELPQAPAELARLKTPTLGLFAVKDPWITPARVMAFEQALLAQHTDIQTFSFSTAPGFALAAQSEVDKANAELAHDRTADFLARHLQ